MRIKPVEIEFGGKTRRLIFGHYALGELQERAAKLTDASQIKSVLLALECGLITETLDARGRETADTLSGFQVASILDTMTEDEISAIGDKILEAQNIAKPPERPTTATPPQA